MGESLEEQKMLLELHLTGADPGGWIGWLDTRLFGVV